MIKTRPENLDVTRVLGYLGEDNVLYCSLGCAASRGQAQAAPVDKDEYPNLVRRDRIAGVGRCPVCAGEFPLDWSAEE